MRKISLIIISLFLINSVQSQITVDGLLNDWKLPLKNYDSEAHLQYDVKNNDSILFVAVRIPEPRFQMKLAMAGMTLFIDTTGKKKQSIAFNYPITPVQKEPLNMGKIMAGGEPNRDKMKALIGEKLTQFSIQGFLSNNGTFDVSSKQNITVKSGYDTLNILSFEYRIPINTFSNSLKNSPDKKISLIFYISSLQMPQMDGMPTDGPPMGGGGMPPGGPPGGGDMPDFEVIQQFFQSSTTVTKYSLTPSK